MEDHDKMQKGKVTLSSPPQTPHPKDSSRPKSYLQAATVGNRHAQRDERCASSPQDSAQTGSTASKQVNPPPLKRARMNRHPPVGVGGAGPQHSLSDDEKQKVKQTHALINGIYCPGAHHFDTTHAHWRTGNVPADGRCLAHSYYQGLYRLGC